MSTREEVLRKALQEIALLPATIKGPHYPMGYSRRTCGCLDCYKAAMQRDGANKAADIARKALAE